jgi:hypothetical protein
VNQILVFPSGLLKKSFLTAKLAKLAQRTQSKSIVYQLIAISAFRQPADEIFAVNGF